MVFSFSEIIDIVIMSAAVGFIFMNFFKPYMQRNVDPLLQSYGFDMEAFKFAIWVTAPAIILHEFGHKFIALSMGFSATFNAAYIWLLIGIMLRLMGSSFIFFVPAYVSWQGQNITNSAIAAVAVAGPLVNAVIAGITFVLLKKNVFPQWRAGLYLTQQINFFLFVFNMIPIPGFDGFHFFRAVLGML